MNHKNFYIIPTDKNLESAIMEKERYSKQVLSEHLLDSIIYSAITQRQTNFATKQIYSTIKDSVYIYNFDKLDPASKKNLKDLLINLS